MRMKKILSGLVAATLVFSSILSSGILVSAQTGNRAPLAPSNLKTELLEQAYGINTKDPSFSWVVNDPDQNEEQTAYRIVFANTLADVESGTYLHDTGWTESSENTYVKVEGLSALLSDNDLCYWQVQTKDKDGKESPLSEPQAFTTAVGSEWASINGIWAGKSDVDPYADWTDYRFEADVTVKENALGLIFHSTDNTHNYMWQFNAVQNKLNPHIMNGSWSQITSVDLAQSGVKIAVNSTFRVRIDIVDGTAKTYVDTTATGDAYALVDTRAADKYGRGIIGFRTGGSETGSVDNLRVVKLSADGTEGDSLYENDFSNATTEFSGCSVQNGALNVPKNQSNGSILKLGGESKVEKGNFVFLRDEFNVENLGNVEKAVLSVTAKSPEKTRQYVFNMYMNGEFVGLGPARFGTNTLYYNTYDVTSLLREGANALGAINYTQDEKSFLSQLTLYYKDGSSAVVSNSGRDKDGWKSLDGTDIFGDDGYSIGTSYFNANAENINANLFPYGWDEPGFDETGWNAVEDKGAIVDSFSLTPYDADNVDRYLYDSAVVENKGDGVYWIDLGKEIVGGLHLDVDSPVSQQMTLYYGEEGNREAGTVQWQMNTGNKYREYWTLKEGQQTIENIGMKTFRYVRIENCPVELTTENVKGLAMHQAFSEDESSFTSSNEMLNEIYDMMKYTIKATNQDLMVDSQSRERGAYEGDALINMLSSYAFEDDYTLSRFSFEYLNTHSTWPAEYVLFSVEMQWYDYLYTGNIDSLRENYEILKGKLFSQYYDEKMGLMGKPNLAYLVDWPSSERDGYMFNEAHYNTVFNAVAVGAYSDMAKIAQALGNEEDAAFYQTRSNTIKENMISKLYNAEKGAFRDGLTSDGTPIDHYAQHATAFPLSYNVFSDTEMAESLAGYIKSQGKIRMSVYGSFFLLRGLYNAEAGDVANALMADTDASQGQRTWAYMIRTLGATISTEAWNEANKSNMTYSHPWGSAPGSQIPQGMFGIQPTTPGFDTFQVKFQPGDVENASIKIPSLKGSIEASFNQNTTSNFMETSVTIPVNTKAEVFLPAASSGHDYLIVDGESVEAVRDGNYLKVELGSGVHTVSLPIAAKLTASVETSSPLFVGEEGKLILNAVDANGESVSFDGAQISYSSSDETVATVAEDGTISYLAEGNATLKADVVFPSLTIGGQVIHNVAVTATADITIQQPKITEVYIKLGIDDTNGELHVGDTTKASLMATLESGKQFEISNVDFTVSDDSVVTVDEDGTITGVTGLKEALLTATTSDYLADLVSTFDISRFELLTFYMDGFDGGNSTFPGLPHQDGKLFVDKGKKVMYDGGKEWTDYTITAKFTVVSNAANITFRAQDANNFYLWQFRSDNKTLKTHVFKNGYSGGFKLLAEIPIPNINTTGENEVMIAVEGNRFMTYLNGALVDITYDNDLASGSVGVRNGSSESFLLDDLAISDRTLVTEREISVAEATDKTILNKVIAYAQSAIDNGEVDVLIPSVKQTFMDAFDHATAVAGRSEATQKQIDQAWAGLLTEIHKLGFVAGDKTELQELYDMASALDLNLYEDGAAKDAFIAALQAAKAVLDDPDALEGEITSAYETLLNAVDALVKLDKTALLSTIAQADVINGQLDKYVSTDAFTAAYAKAIEVRDAEKTTQAEIDAAQEALLNAMLELRYKPDKTILGNLLAQAASIDLSAYTAESVEAYNAVVAAAQAVYDDESPELKQSDVDNAVQQLKEAQSLLVAKDGAAISDSSTVNGDQNAQTGLQSVKTGEQNKPILYVIIVLVAAAVIAVVLLLIKKFKK